MDVLLDNSKGFTEIRASTLADERIYIERKRVERLVQCGRLSEHGRTHRVVTTRANPAAPIAHVLRGHQFEAQRLSCKWVTDVTSIASAKCLIFFRSGQSPGLYECLDQYEEAELLYQRALTLHERTLGLVHPLTQGSINNLAFLYTQEEKYKEAELLYERALEISEQQSGSQHPVTAASQLNLAEVYRSQERYKEAASLMSQALAIYV